MSDDVKHPNLDDLLDGEDTGRDDVSTDESGTENQEDVKPEEKSDDQDSLLEDSLKAEKAKQEFANAWAKKIKTGEATLEELQEKQAWLVPDVKKLMEEDKKPDESELKKLAQEAAAELIRTERSQDEAKKVVEDFSSLKKQILDSNPSYEQKVLLKEKFDSLKDKLNPHEALLTAAEVANIDFDGSTKKRVAMSIPRPSGSTSRPRRNEVDYDDVDPNSLGREELAKFVQSTKRI